MPKEFNNNFFSLKKKTALVIGGAGYLGFEMSKALCLMGAKVIIASRNEKKFHKKYIEAK